MVQKSRLQETKNFSLNICSDVILKLPTIVELYNKISADKLEIVFNDKI